MAGIETIKEYLVGIGFEVDAKTYNKFQDALKQAGKKVGEQTTGMTKMFVEMSVGVVAALGAIAVASVKLMESVATQDLDYKRFALQMFMTTEQAKKLKIAMNAMGEHDIGQIAWIPELRKRFQELRTFQTETQAQLPTDFEEKMEQIRDIGTEWAKFKINMTYGMQNIGYHLFNILEKAFPNLRNNLKELNTYIAGHLDQWGKSIAEFIAPFLKALGWFFTQAMHFWRGMSPDAKKFGILGVLLGLNMVPFLGPMMMVMEVVAGILYLIKDLYAYMNGEESSPILAPIWRTLIEVGESLRDVWDSVRTTFKDLGVDLGPDSLWVSALKTTATIVIGLVNAMATAVDYAQAILKDAADRKSPAGYHWDQAAKRSDIRDKKMHDNLEHLWTGIPYPDEAVTDPAERARLRKQKQKELLDYYIKGGMTVEAARLRKQMGIGSGSGGGNTKQKQRELLDYYIKGGMTAEGAAALVAVQTYESMGLDSNAINSTSGALGLSQWLGSRKRGLFKFAAEMGRSPYDYDVQKAFALKEALNPQYGLRGPNASYNAVHKYEAPAYGVRAKELAAITPDYEALSKLARNGASSSANSHYVDNSQTHITVHVDGATYDIEHLGAEIAKHANRKKREDGHATARMVREFQPVVD